MAVMCAQCLALVPLVHSQLCLCGYGGLSHPPALGCESLSRGPPVGWAEVFQALYFDAGPDRYLDREERGRPRM